MNFQLCFAYMIMYHEYFFFFEENIDKVSQIEMNRSETPLQPLKKHEISA